MTGDVGIQLFIKTQTMKKCIIFLIFMSAILPDKKAAAQTISSMFNAQNYWMPDRGGYGGDLEIYWAEIQASGVKYMRVGGKAYDKTTMWSYTDINLIIDELQGKGITPIIQVPINPNITVAANATICAGYVNNINNTNSQGILYWEIGNEPDGSYTSTTYTATATIAQYTKDCSTAMKGVSGQSGIKIIGPSLSYYDFTKYASFLGGTDNITGTISPGIYYIDYISFNTYPFQGETYLQSKTRTDVINYVNAASQYKAILADIVSKIATVGRTSTLKIAVTEANISSEQDRSDKGADGIGPGSFLGGQFWAEIMGTSMEKGVEFVSFWSVIEGDVGNTYLTDIGYIGAETSKKRSTYWHYQMVANNFVSGSTYLPNILTTTVTPNYHKACAYKNTTANEIGVLIMNQTIQSPRDGSDNSTQTFAVNTNSVTPSGTYDMKFSFAGGVSSVGTYTCSMTKETTMLLVFDITTGVLKKRQTYSLGDALRTTDTGTYTDITTQSDYTNYVDNIRSDIKIGTVTTTTITAVSNKAFRATNSIQLNGPFASSTYTLSLSIDQSCP